MLFLFNDRVVELDAPEARLSRCWRTLGCGDPASLMARDALDFAHRVWSEHANEALELEDDLIGDLAALIVSKTGANAALFRLNSVGGEPRLTVLPEAILAALQANKEDTGRVDASAVWPAAA